MADEAAGDEAAWRDLVAQYRSPAVTGGAVPWPVREELPGGQERMLVRTPRRDGPALAAALRDAAGVRSARKATEPVRVQLDPLELL